MATATKKGKPSTASQALAFVKQQIDAGSTWSEVNNATYGPQGQFTTLFPTPADRSRFAGTEEFKQINQLLSDLLKQERGDTAASGKLLLRLPVSLHAALIEESDREKTSINQLVVAKLSAQLSALYE